MTIGNREPDDGLLDRPLVIGLVNNVSITALRGTRMQFETLLQGAAGPRGVRILPFTLGRHGGEIHGHAPISVRSMPDIDGLVVTGMEPSNANLRSEWLWPELTRLRVWAERRSIPVIWSCLAAHVAALHRDGISRQSRATKLSGVFECELLAPYHPLASGLPGTWRFPHSRYNGLAEEELRARGYTILSRSAGAGVDVFASEGGASSLHFQGHPEYLPDTLLREYLRDLRRYLAGERPSPPALPSDYLDERTEHEFRVLGKRALAGGADILPEMVARAAHAGFRHDWAGAARRLCANWLDIVATRTAGDPRRWWPPEPSPAGAAAMGVAAP